MGGAIARGYFDHSADIDIALFKKQASEISLPNRFLKIDGFEVQCWLSDYQGLDYFYDMLFGLNNQLVADMKWRYYGVEKLEKLPHDFKEKIKDTLLLHSFSIEELERRQKAFMEPWQ